jgi:phosphoribosylformylglycinamidine synthase
LVEVRPDQIADFERHFDGVALQRIGKTVKEPRLRIAGSSGEWVVWSNLADL